MSELTTTKRAAAATTAATLPRYTDRERRVLSVRDLETDESFPCCRCGNVLYADSEHVLLKNKNEKEFIYCFPCWSNVSDRIEWFYFYCAGVYEGRSKSLQCGKILHELLGNRFYYLHKIDRGYVFTDPALKVEQLSLF